MAASEQERSEADVLKDVEAALKRVRDGTVEIILRGGHVQYVNVKEGTLYKPQLNK